MEENNALFEAREDILKIDEQITDLFARRMRAAETVAAYKKERGLAVEDPEREAFLIEKNAGRIEDETIRGFYPSFQKCVMSLSKQYQTELMREAPDVIPVSLGDRSYDILIRRGALQTAKEELDLNRRVLVVTDYGVPEEYVKTIALQCKEPHIVTVPSGEGSKTLNQFEMLLGVMLEKGFTRSDCVVAVGGGVVGDLAGFTAASYLRGVDFHNVPTTVLSQVDSSVGGKNAVNLNGVKNVVGAFYQPKKVLIDPDVLKTLARRQVSNGLAESVKMALTSDPALFSVFEEAPSMDALDLETVIRLSVLIKRDVVQLDEKEQGLRRILNFGHTLGHGLESPAAGTDLLHGECVALGMLPFCSESVRVRLIPVLQKLNLPVQAVFDEDAVMEAITHDKKGKADGVNAVFVPEVGSHEFRFLPFDEIRGSLELLKKVKA